MVYGYLWFELSYPKDIPVVISPRDARPGIPVDGCQQLVKKHYAGQPERLWPMSWET